MLNFRQRFLLPVTAADGPDQIKSTKVHRNKDPGWSPATAHVFNPGIPFLSILVDWPQIESVELAPIETDWTPRPLPP